MDYDAYENGSGEYENGYGEYENDYGAYENDYENDCSDHENNYGNHDDYKSDYERDCSAHVNDYDDYVNNCDDHVNDCEDHENDNAHCNCAFPRLHITYSVLQYKLQVLAYNLNSVWKVELTKYVHCKQFYKSGTLQTMYLSPNTRLASSALS